MRIYVPATLPMLRLFVESGTIGSPPFVAYAVTPTLREWYAEGDLEELEYAALMEAVRASLRLLRADENAPRRRVALAVDAPDESVRPVSDAGRAAVRISVEIPLAKVAALHVDDIEAVDDVQAAVDAILAADAGDDEALFIVDGSEAHELLWYATQEIPDVLR